MDARMVTEISAKLPDEPGLLAKVTGALLAAKVDIISIVAWSNDGTATFQFTTEQAEAAAAAVDAMGAQVASRTAVAVDMMHRPGALDAAASRIAEKGIDITHMYGSAVAAKGAATIVFETEDDEAVLHLLKGSSTSPDVIL